MPKKQVWLDARGPKFNRYANQVARSAVRISQCQKCSYPVLTGYCCTFCGDVSPREPRKNNEQ